VIKIIKALLSASVLLVFSFSHSLAAPPGAHLDVTQMFVDDPDNPTSIMIIGMSLDQVPKSAVSRHVCFKKAGLTAIRAATYFENTKNQIPEDEL